MNENVNGLSIDKQNETVAYNDEQHKYWVQGTEQTCISVTTLIGKYVQPFDSEFWSSCKAFEALVTPAQFSLVRAKLYEKKKFDQQLLVSHNIKPEDYLSKRQEILDSWKEKNIEACERGTAIHKMHEDMHLGGKTQELQKFGLGGEFKTIIDNRVDVDSDGIYPELLLHRISDDQVLRLAGQADLVIIKDKQLTLLDYKTNKEIKKTSYYNQRTKKRQMMKYPLGHIMDCNYYHYVVQLSTYAWMLQKRYPELEVKTLALIHYDHDGKQTIYELPYLKREVELMLADYKSSIKIKSEYDKIKPIVY